MCKRISFKSLVIGLLLITTLLACQPAANPIVEVPLAEAELEPTATKEYPTQVPVNLSATADAQSTLDALAATSSQATAQAQASATSSAKKTQMTFDRRATATQFMVLKQTATADVILLATAQAQPIADQIQALYSQGVLDTTEGDFTRLEDFDESWAQIDWFKWWRTGYSPENFVIRTDASWSSASDKANWYNSGCAFVFGEIDQYNFHFIHVAMDGYVYLAYWQKGKGHLIAQRPVKGITRPDGKAEIMLVVHDKRVTVYVDGTQVLSEYASLLKSGGLGLTLSSGTNIGYGTRCQMKNVDLWIIE